MLTHSSQWVLLLMIHQCGYSSNILDAWLIQTCIGDHFFAVWKVVEMSLWATLKLAATINQLMES